MSLMVGCPVRRREWVLPAWFEAVETAAEIAAVAPQYVFVCDPRDPSADLVRSLAAEWTREVLVVEVEEDIDRDDRRLWYKREALQHMVDLRNQLLGAVRATGPDAFLSLDSDILIAPDVIANLLESLQGYDAVGGRTYMTRSGKGHPSWATYTHSGGLRRVDAEGVFPAEIIMAIKAMSPAAYAVNYEFHTHGEDVGWSLACAKAGVKLGFDGRAGSKHCMDPAALDRVDARVGY